MSTAPRILLAGSLLFGAGCGATTVRVTAAPTVDTSGRAGFESTLALGIGLPLDFKGRSHHYLQELTAIGGALDGQTRAGTFTMTESVDYVHWAEPRMDLRAGAHFAFEQVHDKGSIFERYGFGSHFALLPIVYQNDRSWLVTHLCVGPELRGEALRGPGGWLGRGALPLVVELSFLGAGD